MHRDRRTGGRVTWLVAAFALLPFASTASGPAPVVRLPPPDWLLDETPSLSLGGPQGGGSAAGEFLWIRDAFLLPSGSVAVLDGGSGEVRVFDLDGRVTGQVGGMGDGPGEFRYLASGRALGGDTLRIFDLTSQRVTDLTIEGTVIKTVPALRGRSGLPRLVGRPSEASEVGGVPHARINLTTIERARRGTGTNRDELVVGLYTAEGATTARVVQAGPSFTVREGQRSLTRPVPFAPQALVALGDGVAVIGNTHRASFDMIDFTGKRIGRFQASGVSRSATEGDWSEFRTRFLDEAESTMRLPGVGEVSGSDLHRRFLAETPRGRRHPLFSEARLRGNEELWVRVAQAEPGEQEWWVVTTGGVVGRVTFPVSWTLLDAGVAHVIVTVKDELDVESVHVYHLTRR